MRQIIEGVQYMHDNYIMHLDMKPENILCVTRTGNRIKLIDFGLARRFDPAQKLQVMFGTPDFAAPEVLSYERVTPAADMWSVGVICYVLLSGLSPFMGNSDLETMTNVTRAIYDFDDEAFDPISDEAKDFIAKLLIKEPTKRLTPQQCLQHKWLAKMPAKKGKAQQLDKTKLKKYVVRRRWQKAVTAIMALSRMGANLSLTGGAGGTTAGSAAAAKRSSALGSSGASRLQQPQQQPKTSTTTTSSTRSSTSSRSSSVAPPKVLAGGQVSSQSSTTKTSSSSTTSSTSRFASASSSLSSSSSTSSPSRSTLTTTTTSSRTASTKPAPAATSISPTSPNRTFATSSNQRVQISSMSTTRRKY
jgi:serine/threonine protein kinase